MPASFPDLEEVSGGSYYQYHLSDKLTIVKLLLIRAVYSCSKITVTGSGTW